MKRTYSTPENIGAVRRKSWETRRAKYGEAGHEGIYTRSPALLKLVIGLMNEGVLSEGQVQEASGLDRDEIRKLSQSI